MFILKLVLVGCAILLKCEAAFVDTLKPCSLTNEDCIKDLYSNIMSNIGAEGIPEINIPPIDPFKISNITVTVLDAIKLTMTDGVVKGISKCQVTKFHIDMEALTGIMESICNLTVRTNVVVEGSSQTAQTFLGIGSVDGTGKGKVKLENLFMHFDFPIIPFKKDDGEIYFKVIKSNLKYKYDVDKGTFAAEKIIIGTEDISKIVVPYLNENFKTVMKSFGNTFFDKAMEIFHTIFKAFCEGIPAKRYITDDLTPYVKN